MFAVRCLRHATGTMVGGIDFAHAQWTLLDNVSRDIREAGQERPDGMPPLLAVIEIESTDDPRLKPFAVEGATKHLDAEPTAADMDALKAENARLLALIEKPQASKETPETPEGSEEPEEAEKDKGPHVSDPAAIRGRGRPRKASPN